MALVSYGFGFFCAVLLLLYYIVPGRFQWRILLAASVLFYGFAGPLWILYPAASSVSVWYLARKIGSMTDQYRNWVQKEQPDQTQKKAYNQRLKARQKRFLILGLLLNFGILAVLKYTNFLLSNVEVILHLAGISGEMEYADWVLPLGISYYTFQSMGYLIDVYQRKYDPEKSLLRTALFVFYFPQLTVGPISRFDRLKEELYSPHRFSMDRLAAGGQRALWGYFKKLVVADRIGPAASMITGSPEIYGGVYVLLGIAGHVIQLYADFSGGIDIILGISEMFGIRLPENFDRPFSSRSLAEFWRRWHMTLMQWFRGISFSPYPPARRPGSFLRLLAAWPGKRPPGKCRSIWPPYSLVCDRDLARGFLELGSLGTGKLCFHAPFPGAFGPVPKPPKPLPFYGRTRIPMFSKGTDLFCILSSLDVYLLSCRRGISTSFGDSER
ncbi:MAG: MBOAT family O-acyltransferase [Lachnospiraceae bacterium]